MAAGYPEMLHYSFHETLNPYNISSALVWCRAPKWRFNFYNFWLHFSTSATYIQLLLLLLRFLNVGLPLLKHRENLMRIILCQLLPANTKHLCLNIKEKMCHFPYSAFTHLWFCWVFHICSSFWVLPFKEFLVRTSKRFLLVCMALLMSAKWSCLRV